MNTPKRTKPILRWPGGKTRLLPHILPLIKPHNCYVEAFAGGLAVLLAKERSRIEVVNDLNGTLVALYRNVQHHMPALLDEIQFVLNSRQTLKEFLGQPGLTEIQRAARYLVCNKISFGGGGRSFAVSRRGGGGAAISRENIQESIRSLNQRLDRVVIEHLEYERCVKLYDSDQATFFLDPPYLNAKPEAYRGWTEEEMTHFRDVVDDIKGDWIVTTDGSEFNRQLFTGRNIRQIENRNGMVNQGRHGQIKMSEFIITPK